MAGTSTPTRLSCASCMSDSETSSGQGISSSNEEAYVWGYKINGFELTSLSTFQALTLVFKGHTGLQCSAPLNEEDVCLCSSCGDMLGKILEMRQEFLAVSLPNSLVKRLLRNELENYPPLLYVPPILYEVAPILVDPLETNVVGLGTVKSQSKISYQQTSSPTPGPLPPILLMSGTQTLSALSHTNHQVAPILSHVAPQHRPKRLRKQVFPTQPKVRIQKSSTQATIQISKPSRQAKVQIQTRPITTSSPLPANRSGEEGLQEYQNLEDIPLTEFHLDETSSSELMDLRGETLFGLVEDNCVENANYSDLSTNVATSLQMENLTATGEYAQQKKKTKYKRKKKKYVPNPYTTRSTQAYFMTKYSEEDRKLLEITCYKCHECTNAAQSFDSFRDWVLHHLEVHERDLGYGSAEQLKMLPQLPSCYGLFRPCPECGMMKKSNSKMLHHIKMTHLKQVSKFNYPCTICQKKLSSKRSLETHMETLHTGKEQLKPYLCTLCGSCFRHRASLDGHERTHLGLVKFKYTCDICHSKFITKGRLNDHRTTHSDERTFPCESCPMKFKTQRQLNYHTNYNHVKDKTPTVFCEFCQKGFRRNIQLKGHLMCVHKLSTEEANKLAKIKGFVFRVQENGEHVYYEKPRKPKTCEYCQKTYVRREGLFLHLISVHGKTEEESKEMTGLESKRDLFPSRHGGGGRRRKNVRKVVESD